MRASPSPKSWTILDLVFKLEAEPTKDSVSFIVDEHFNFAI
jgi:hypothetical protein